MTSYSLGSVVETPYGRCVVRNGGIEQSNILCQPITWQLAEYSSTQPKFYMNRESISAVKYSVGDAVWSQYGGEGVIVKITETHFVVTLKNWQLADGKSPTCYLQAEAITPLADRDFVVKIMKEVLVEVEKKDPAKKREVDIREGIDKAVTLKNDAATHFKKEKFQDAQKAYLTALETMNKMGYDMPDPFRAEVLEHTIPCHNNIALCCIKQKNYDEAKIYANNGVMLIDAMETQISKGSKVWEEFQKRGMTLEKLTKDWKKKSLFYKGKACLLQRDYDGACENFDLALRLVKDDPALTKQSKELSDFLAQAKKLKAVAERKEKDTWKKAFSKNTEEGKKQPPAPAPAPAPAAEMPKVASPPRSGKVDVSKYIKGGSAPVVSSSSGSSSNSSSSSSVGSERSDTAMPPAAGGGSGEGAGDAPVMDEKEDNLAMYLLGGAVAVAVGIGAYMTLAKRR
jgi:tetratricopeptide (TPR) repeat protein